MKKHNTEVKQWKREFIHVIYTFVCFTSLIFFFLRNAAMQLDNVENIQKVVQECEEMDGDDYENLNPELKQIYITYALEVRRRKHLEKKRKIAEKSGYLLYVVYISFAYRILLSRIGYILDDSF